MTTAFRTALLGFALAVLAPLLLQGCAKSGDGAVEDAIAMPSQADTAVHAIIRVPTGQVAPENLQGKAADWRKAGIVSKALWVNSVAEERPTPGFSALLTLEFPNPQAYASWFELEGSKLAAPLSVDRVDVLAQEQVAAYDPAITVFKVSYYAPKLSRELSAEWVEGYLKKYLHAQLQAGILVTYAMYLEEDAVEKGQLLLVLQYHDATIAREAESTKAKLNNELIARDANYAALEKAKTRVRTTQSVTLAEYQRLPTR